jgi:hypothetical protein
MPTRRRHMTGVVGNDDELRWQISVFILSVVVVELDLALTKINKGFAYLLIFLSLFHIKF